MDYIAKLISIWSRKCGSVMLCFPFAGLHGSTFTPISTADDNC